MDYVMGALAGFIYGAIAGTIKYNAIWKGALKSAKQENASQKSFYIRMAASSLVNVAVLLLPLTVRKSLPFSFTAMIIACAFGLSLFSRLFTVQSALKKEG